MSIFMALMAFKERIIVGCSYYVFELTQVYGIPIWIYFGFMRIY